MTTREEYVDLIAGAIDDSMGPDWAVRLGAQYVADVLFSEGHLQEDDMPEDYSELVDDGAAAGTGLLTNPGAEFQAFKSWWRRTILAEPVPSPESHMFDAWMASARHHVAPSRGFLDGFDAGLADAAKVAENFVGDRDGTPERFRIATAIRARGKP